MLAHLNFLDADGTFSMENPENKSYLYFPLASETGLKSAVAPNLGGDAKVNQETFLLEPVSAENLHNNRSTRNFWLRCDGEAWSCTGSSARQESERFTSAQEHSRVTAGFLWHTLERTSQRLGIAARTTLFCPLRDNVELMAITVQNTRSQPLQIVPFAAIPLYGRSADNLRDHRNVTSMLHRIRTTAHGVVLKPTMSFDERGHRPNHTLYYVMGFGPDEQQPEAFYPTVESFLGKGGTYLQPRAVIENLPGVPAGATAAGREAMGAFRFPARTLAPGETAQYIVMLGVTDDPAEIEQVFARYGTPARVKAALKENRSAWREKVNVSFHTGREAFDRLMKWVCLQPFLRRLFGCSFLPHHDYGRGGRGWRDLWQDCLSLLLMEPDDVGQMIEKNFGGVRIDGTNATIIGDGDGSFIADRNGIARVWMDHALWPQMTTKLYIDQTGDVEILNRQAPYFKDAQALRGTAIDEAYRPEQGTWQRTADGSIYTGTVLEHLLVEQLAAFYEVGAHNLYRLRGADWNDALDMAAEHGESVAFTCAYAGNLRELASLIRTFARRTGAKTAEVFEELLPLLNTETDLYDDASAKRALLSQYAHSVQHELCGRKAAVPLEELAENLERRADWLASWLRRHEWIDAQNGEGWYNSYYDNHGRAVEGFFPTGVRMMLTGQVFAIMGQVATDAQIPRITASADHYLYREEIGGYRLNTDFRELKFDLGRMFGFAYGEKENGAVFSHMAVMYANALYRRGFAREGWKALSALADTALDFDRSCIYPGIPEYFRADGRGMYHYLTGAASWYMLTMITQVFGVRGEEGDLVLAPKLLAAQFDAGGTAGLSVTFAGRKLQISYENPDKLAYGSYRVGRVLLDGAAQPLSGGACAKIPRKALQALPAGTLHTLVVTLLTK